LQTATIETKKKRYFRFQIFVVSMGSSLGAAPTPLKSEFVGSVHFCRQHNTTPMTLIEIGRAHRKGLEDLL